MQSRMNANARSPYTARSRSATRATPESSRVRFVVDRSPGGFFGVPPRVPSCVPDAAMRVVHGAAYETLSPSASAGVSSAGSSRSSPGAVTASVASRVPGIPAFRRADRGVLPPAPNTNLRTSPSSAPGLTTCSCPGTIMPQLESWRTR